MSQVALKFAPKQFCKDLLNNQQLPKAEAIVTECCVVFVDLKGFTKQSERMDLKSLLKLIDKFYALIIKITEDYHGIVS